MPTSPSKTLSPAELAKLEHAFATDPASDAYKALAEAYLGMGRYMEAMVVCKKGVKAHPSVADPRVLLARVYAEQGKDKKALEELSGALTVAPNDKTVLRMLGNLQIRNGEADAGKATLMKAWQADPNDAETLEVLKANGVQPPAAAAPQVVAPAPVAQPMAPQAYAQAPQQYAQPVAPQAYAQAPVAHPANGSGAPPMLVPNAAPAAAPVAPGVWAQGAGQPAHPQQPQQNVFVAGPGAVPHPQAQRPVAPQGAPARTMSNPNGVAVRPSAQRPAMPRPAPRPVRAYDEDDEPLSEENEISSPRRSSSKKSGGSKGLFFALLILAPLSVGGYSVWRHHVAIVNRDVKKALENASNELKHDSYASYQKACTYADAALDLDPSSVAAHGYLAYAWAIRWGEHGGGDEARKKAEEHLAAAKSGDEVSSQLYAAEALIKTYSGKSKEALTELDGRVKQFDAEGKHSSVLQLTLGLIQMNAGDLENARQSLEKAQTLAPDDPRVYSALGTVYRRLGQDSTAWKNYDFALRYERNHPESQLGKALLMLEQEDPQLYVGAAKMIKALLEQDPPPSPRQLATAQLARAFVVSRVWNEAQLYKPEDAKPILDGAGVPADKKAADAEIAKAEDTGFTLDRTNPELHLIKGRRLFLEGQTDAAVAEIKTAIKMDSTRAQFYVELARALLAKKGGEKEAQAALEDAIKTMGSSPKLQMMLGQAYQRQGQFDKAIAQYELAMGDGKTKAPEAKLALGSAYREKKDYVKAVDILSKASQEFVGQPSRTAAAYTELARALEEKGDREKAGETYQLALKADADYSDSYYFFAHYLAGDKANAGKAKIAAQEYLKREPKGDYAAEAQKLAQ